MSGEPVAIAAYQIGTVAAVLARAFHDDPLAGYFAPDPVERARVLPPHFAAFVRYVHLFGEGYTTPEPVHAGALWIPPDRGEMTAERVTQAGLHEIPAILGAPAFARLSGVLNYLEQYHAHDAPPRHWYLPVLGVDPARQGEGIGSDLLQPILARADAAGLPCYLETVQPRNVPFYCKHGFEVVVEDVEPTSRLRFWTFKREPRAA